MKNVADEKVLRITFSMGLLDSTKPKNVEKIEKINSTFFSKNNTSHFSGENYFHPNFFSAKLFLFKIYFCTK